MNFENACYTPETVIIPSIFLMLGYAKEISVPLLFCMGVKHDHLP